MHYHLWATFCLIHGNWHDGSCWTTLVERLRARGHEAVAPDLPFDDPRADYEARAQPALAALNGVDGFVDAIGARCIRRYARTGGPRTGIRGRPSFFASGQGANMAPPEGAGS